MAALDDLKAAVSAQQAADQIVITAFVALGSKISDLNARVAELEAALTAAQVEDPAISQAAQDIQAEVAKLNALVSPPAA